MTSVPSNAPASARVRGLVRITAAAAMLAGLAGCVVAPVGPGYHVPRGVVYVAPTYAAPGPGWIWRHHHRHGWGWRHPHRGWHRGWH